MRGIEDPRTGARLVKIGEGREAEIFSWDTGEVLRLFRQRGHRGLLHREMDAMTAARLAGAPVPEVIAEIEVDGRAGLVVQRVDGPDQLSLLGRRPLSVLTVGRTLGRLHVALHRIGAPSSLPSVREVIAGRITCARGLPPSMAAAALSDLDALPEGDRLCHGDFHPGNVLEAGGGPVVIDWTNASRGDPAADVARTRLLLSSGALPPGAPVIARAGHRIGRHLLARSYEGAYERADPAVWQRARRWEGVVAVARLAEEIESERAALLARVRQRYGDETRPSSA